MPTGGDARMETYERLVDFAKRHHLIIVNDNPYSLILNEHPMSILQVPGAKDCCIEFNSMSKSHNMPGWRVAMAVSNPTFISWLLKIKSNVDNGTFKGIQLAAAEAYNTNTEEWHHQNNIENYRRRRNIAEKIMTTLGCTFDRQQVGMFLWGRIPDRYEKVETLQNACCMRHGYSLLQDSSSVITESAISAFHFVLRMKRSVKRSERIEDVEVVERNNQTK
jgi:aspartate/methionine/tyrosine aminotransferase